MKYRKWIALLIAAVLLLAAGCSTETGRSSSKRKRDNWAEQIPETDASYFDYKSMGEGAVAIVALLDHSLTEIRTPKEIAGCTVTAIYGEAFADCTELERVVISEGVTFLGYNAFWNCTGLQKIQLPDSLGTIGEYCFANCSALESITLPKNVGSISNGILWGCNSLQEIEVVSGNAGYKSVDGVLFDITGSRLYQYPSGRSSARYTVPEGTEVIWEYAFAGCVSLEKVQLPESVENLYEGAFMGCKNLKEITIPFWVTSIGNDVFEGCRDLTIRTEKGSYAWQWAQNHGYDVTEE